MRCYWKYKALTTSRSTKRNDYFSKQKTLGFSEFLRHTRAPKMQRTTHHRLATSFKTAEIWWCCFAVLLRKCLTCLKCGTLLQTKGHLFFRGVQQGARWSVVFSRCYVVWCVQCRSGVYCQELQWGWVPGNDWFLREHNQRCPVVSLPVVIIFFSFWSSNQTNTCLAACFSLLNHQLQGKSLILDQGDHAQTAWLKRAWITSQRADQTCWG